MCKKMSLMVVLACMYVPQAHGDTMSVLPVKSFSSTGFLRERALQNGATLMRLCQIPDGNERATCPSWNMPDVVVVGARRFRVKRGQEGILLVPMSGGDTNAIAFATVSVARNEKEARIAVFAELAFCSLPLSVVAKGLSVERSGQGWICLRGDRLAEWRGGVEKMAQCRILFKNVAIRVEALSEEKEIALALLDAGFQGDGGAGEVETP